MNEFMKATDQTNAVSVSRRGFIAASASAALVAGAARPSQATLGNQATPVALSSDKDPYALAARFNKFLRVTDVTDGLDAVGRADLTLLDPAIRPLWMGMRFWGPAVTMRVCPRTAACPWWTARMLSSNTPSGRDGGHARRARRQARLRDRDLDQRRPRVRLLGIEQLDGHAARGVAGIVTDGYARDTDEIVMQRAPWRAAGSGAPSSPVGSN